MRYPLRTQIDTITIRTNTEYLVQSVRFNKINAISMSTTCAREMKQTMPAALANAVKHSATRLHTDHAPKPNKCSPLDTRPKHLQLRACTKRTNLRCRHHRKARKGTLIK